MDEISELYEEIILDHNRNPRYFDRVPNTANHSAHGDNPLCGDQYSVYLNIANDRIEDVGFKGAGCAISKASASLMLEAVKGKSIEEAETLIENMHDLLTGETHHHHDEEVDVGKLDALGGVREFPMRVKCATLAWHILNAAIHNEETAVSTEK
jgi:nitrogen fixation protein NifU and related proteins